MSKGSVLELLSCLAMLVEDDHIEGMQQHLNSHKYNVTCEKVLQLLNDQGTMCVEFQPLSRLMVVQRGGLTWTTYPDAWDEGNPLENPERYGSIFWQDNHLVASAWQIKGDYL